MLARPTDTRGRSISGKRGIRRLRNGRLVFGSAVVVVACLAEGILLAQWQVNPGGFARPNVASIDSASEDSSAMFLLSGETPLRQARLVPMPLSAMFGKRSVSLTVFSRSPGMMPSRRSPSSTMSTTPCVRSASRAAVESRLMTSSSVLKLVSA